LNDEKGKKGDVSSLSQVKKGKVWGGKEKRRQKGTREGRNLGSNGQEGKEGPTRRGARLLRMGNGKGERWVKERF